jgi:glycyl-tRNA synthetase alpha chain
VAKSYQEMIHQLQSFWMHHGCVVVQPYNSEVGAGTFNPNTFLRCLGPEPWKVAYVEPSKRPKDGRYGENPNRVHQFLQYQVLLKPAPENVQDLYLESLRAIGFSPEEHDIRFVEDDWESPTLGAAGLGWEVWLDGMEVTQFTYFQQAGGLELEVVSCELTYGLLRLAMFLQRVDHVMNLHWGAGLTWGEVNGQFEREFSEFNFKAADVVQYFRWFEEREKEAEQLLARKLVFPGYDAVCKCSHLFNVLEARGAISVTERTGYIARVRRLARMAAKAYVEKREAMGFPLLEEKARGNE